jgi:polyribonucleotide nucleotidyltransferase
MQKREYSVEVGGKLLTAEFSDLAKQANGSVILRYGNSAVLATVVMSKETRDGLDYFPLTVDYEEKFYAAGEILGSRFVRREGRPSDEAILSGRVVDRTIRPLFDRHIRNDVQVVIIILAIDEDDPDMLAVNAASLALATSDIPWHGPVSAVRIGKQAGSEEFIVNPTYPMRESKDASLDLVACGRDGTINMIEIGARELPEEVVTLALERAQTELATIQSFQETIVREIGKKKRELPKPETPAELRGAFGAFVEPKLEATVFSGSGKAKLEELKGLWLAHSAETLPNIGVALADDHFEEAVNKLLHQEALERNRRPDGRNMDEVRTLYAQAGEMFEVLHGSGVFYRGETHVLSVLTLGGPEDSLIIDSMEQQETHKHFMLHYNFPPFSTGETGRLGGTNRRMVGHGALAERALVAVIPEKSEFPYTIRVVSEVMSSNGSTSMASTCAATLALMDGGVPIKAPVAGIALGLMMESPEKYKILTDIQGPEDHHGDMDLKVAGTKNGITAAQMDVKVRGVSIAILKEALERGKQARLEILDVIGKTIAEPRASISKHAPHIATLAIRPDQIGLVIGSGGKTINEIKDTSGVDEITIEEDGTVYVTGSHDAVPKAVNEIVELTREYSAGERFDGVVTRILDFGAFVKIGRNAEGLVHISEIASTRVEKVTDVLSIGDRVPVVIKNIDEKERINLSIKAADENFATNKGKGHKSSN